MAEKISWTELLVHDTEGPIGDTLGDLLKIAPANFDNLILNDDGSILEWPGFMVAAVGEDADWDTSLVAVDWDGFSEALDRALRRNVDGEGRPLD